MQAGDAGAALIIGKGNAAFEIVGVNSIYADFVDHYRAQGQKSDYTLEERWFRDEAVSKLAPQVVAPVLKRAGITPSDIDHLIAPFSNPKLSQAAARALRIEKSAIADGCYMQCGNAGAAHPFLALGAVIEKAKPGEWVLLTAFGQGCDVVLMRATAEISRLATQQSLKTQLDKGSTEENLSLIHI